jgi:hypothetical protein
VFRELHGFLGEGKGQFEDGLFVNLHLINAPPDFGPERILERLKVCLIVACVLRECRECRVAC